MKNELNNTWRYRSTRGLLSGLACLAVAGALAYPGPSAFAVPPQALPPLEDLSETDRANHLISGTTTIVQLESRQSTDLSFMADGPGMLTLSYTDTNNNRSFEILGPDGRRLNWSNRLQTEHVSVGNTQVAYVTVPLAVAGEHTIRLQASGAGELGVGAAWMPFEQVAIGLVNNQRGDFIIEEIQAPPPAINPDSDLATVITPGTPQVGQIPAGPSDRTFAWMRFTAESDGELALMFTSARADLTLELYEEGSYDRTLQDIDNDLNQSVGCEGMVINARAGRTYMVSINNLRSSAVQFNLRSVWLGDDPAGAGEAGEADAPEVQEPIEAVPIPFGVQPAGRGQQGRVQLQLNGDLIIVNGNLIDDKELQQLFAEPLQEPVELTIPAEQTIEAVEEAIDE